MFINWQNIFSRKEKVVRLNAIYITENAGQAMQLVHSAEAVEAKGLIGDRYYNKTGYWDPVEGCQVTLISEHDLQKASRGTGLEFNNGQHRRNLVVTGVKTKSLEGKKFQIGEAIFCYDKPRPPCGYLNKIEGRGMARALSYNSGACIRVVRSGQLSVGNALIIL